MAVRAVLLCSCFLLCVSELGCIRYAQHHMLDLADYAGCSERQKRLGAGSHCTAAQRAGSTVVHSCLDTVCGTCYMSELGCIRYVASGWSGQHARSSKNCVLVRSGCSRQTAACAVCCLMVDSAILVAGL